MSDISLEKKFYLKNKYLNKIIKNIADVNNYLELLNNFNHKMIRQYGGTQEQFNLINKGIGNEIQLITTLNQSSEKQIEEVNKQQLLLVQNINEIQKLVAQIPVKATQKLDQTNINTALTNLEKETIGTQEQTQDS
jgi:predicted transcriptional regulator